MSSLTKSLWFVSNVILIKTDYSIMIDSIMVIDSGSDSDIILQEQKNPDKFLPIPD